MMTSSIIALPASATDDGSPTASAADVCRSANASAARRGLSASAAALTGRTVCAPEPTLPSPSSKSSSRPLRAGASAEKLGAGAAGGVVSAASSLARSETSVLEPLADDGTSEGSETAARSLG